MNFVQTGKMLAKLSAVYTARLMPTIDENSISTWAELLADVDNEKVMSVVNNWMRTNKYPPTIADIIDGVKENGKLPKRQNPKT